MGADRGGDASRRPDVCMARATAAAEYLVGCLEELGRAGGSPAAATAQGWSLRDCREALAGLRAARDGLDAEISRLESRARGLPR